MGLRSFFSSLYYAIFPGKKREKEYQKKISQLESSLAHVRNSSISLEGRLSSAQGQIRTLRQQAEEQNRVLGVYEKRLYHTSNSGNAGSKEKYKHQTEVGKMSEPTVPAKKADLEASVDEAKQAAQYQMQRFEGIAENGKRGDAKFVALYSLVKYLETFEGEVRGSIATDQFQELGQQNAGVVQTAQGLNQAAHEQDGQKYVAGVAGLIAKAVDTAGVAIKAEAIKTGDYETYRKQIPDEAIALIHQGVAGVLGTTPK